MVFEGCFDFLENTVFSISMDRIWILRCFQTVAHSKTALATIFYLWVRKRHL